MSKEQTNGKPRKKYFPNKVAIIQKVDASFFEPHEYEELMEWRVCNWTIPPHTAAIIRAENTRTGRIKEYIYKQPRSATKKIAQLAEDEDIIITVATNDAIHHLSSAN